MGSDRIRRCESITHEDAWIPAYNIIEIDDLAEGEGDLHIRVYVRTWQPGAHFAADLASQIHTHLSLISTETAPLELQR